jgi:hypothetical protein
MHMKNIFVVTLIVLAVIFSCKKKDDPAPPTNSTTGSATTSSTTGGTTTGGTTTGGTTTGGTTTGGTTGTPTSNATSFHGILSIFTYSSTSSMGQTFTLSAGNAYFSATPVQTPANNCVLVKKVLLDGDSLMAPGSGSQYATSPIAPPETGKWEVQGANGIPSFTYNASFAAPAATNLNLIPAIIDKSNGFSISMNVSNSKTSSIIISDGTGNVSGTAVLPLSNGVNNINLSSAQLNGMTTTTAAVIMVQLENNSNHLIGGKDFSFKKQGTFVRQVEIKN